jgi:hypothetical protein
VTDKLHCFALYSIVGIVGNMKVRDYSGDAGVDGRIILKISVFHIIISWPAKRVLAPQGELCSNGLIKTSIIKHYTMKSNWGVDVQIRVFLTSSLVGGR